MSVIFKIKTATFTEFYVPDTLQHSILFGSQETGAIINPHFTGKKSVGRKIKQFA